MILLIQFNYSLSYLIALKTRRLLKILQKLIIES